MDWLIWTGAALTMAGIAALGGCIWLALSARRAAPEPAALQARMQRVALLNMVALGVSTMGLMLVVIGILLG